MNAQKHPFDTAKVLSLEDFFARNPRRRHIPRKQARTDPGLPQHRQWHRDDPIYLGIFLVVLIVGAFLVGWRIYHP